MKHVLFTLVNSIKWLLKICESSKKFSTRFKRGNSNIFMKSLRVDRSSRPEVFCKKGVLRNFTKFTRKTPVPYLLFNKVAGLSLQLY